MKKFTNLYFRMKQFHKFVILIDQIQMNLI